MAFEFISLSDDSYFDWFDGDWSNKVFCSRMRRWELDSYQTCLSLKVVWRSAQLGEHRIGHRSVFIPAGHGCIVNPNQQVHSFGKSDDWIEGISIFFDDALVRNVLASVTRADPSLSPEVDHQTRLPVFDENLFSITGSGLEASLRKLTLNHDPTNVLEQMVSLIEGMINAQRPFWSRLKSLPLARTSTRLEAHRRLKRAKEFMDELHDPGISMKALASQFCMTHFNFIRLFKHLFGISPYQYFQRVKLARARQLLSQDADINIADIAFRLGYADHSSFGKRFKRHFGLTPAEYRIRCSNLAGREGLET